MSRRFAIFVLILAALACMAPTCTSATAEQQQTQMLVCAADGTPIGIGAPGSGWSTWECVVDYKNFNDPCACWVERGPLLLGTPVQDPEAAALCIEHAAALEAGFILNDTGIATGACNFLGYYAPPPAGPQSITAETDDEP